MEYKTYTVSALNQKVKSLLDGDPNLGAVFVKGELSNYKVYPSGHHYFTMKDAEGALRCVMFRSSASRLKFRPENGMKVIAFGRVTVFPRDGAYQLYCNDLTPDGVGDLHVAYEQLKEKLFKEGLFDPGHKKPIPQYPERIAVITSSAGAAVRDIIRVLGKRYPLAKVILLPVRVQGVEAPPEIVGAIKYANRYQVADVIIAGRGGGSIEDLWAFNDERVARAIYASQIPIISAVGHEPDVTIADFVADLRAATPSNGAELAVPDRLELKENLRAMELRMSGALRSHIRYYRQRLDEISRKRVIQSPLGYIEDRRIALDSVQAKFIAAAQNRLATDRNKYIHLAAKLDALSPLKVLGRGFGVVYDQAGHLIKSTEDVQVDDQITVRMADGSLQCRVEDKRKEAIQ